jgi:hypothetical protein
VPLSEVLGLWKYGERYGENIIRDLNSGTEGWIDWNLYLDETGGPNHVQNLCVAPIICDTRTDEILYQAAYWYLGHFSKYVRPGAVRVLSSTSRDVLEVVAFQNIDGSLAVVVMNQSEEDCGFWLKVAGSGSVYTEAIPRSITTFVLDGEEAVGASHRFRGPIATPHGTYVKVTDGAADQGPLVQTAEIASGWETFEGWLTHSPTGELLCRIRSHHRTWLSVGRDGRVTAAPAAGEHEQFRVVLTPGGDGECALKSVAHGSFLSVEPGVGTPLVTVAVAIAGKNELFNIRGLPGNGC